MVFNRHLYNQALWNAGREEIGGLLRSIISAHTGPHIQAVVGESPLPTANQSGIAFISDFTIQEGTVKKPPSSYNFPDLAARIQAVKAGAPPFVTLNTIAALIKGIPFKDMSAAIYLVQKQPELAAFIFGLFQKDLLASIIGELGQADLPAILFAAGANLAAKMTGFAAPDLGGRIFGNPTGNLGAIIWAPHDLPAMVKSIEKGDLFASILGFGFKDLSGRMLGISAPNLRAYVTGFGSGQLNLGAKILEPAFLPATIEGTFGDSPTGPGVAVLASIIGTGGFGDIPTSIVSLIPGISNLAALIKTGGDFDLPAIINFLGAGNLNGIIGTIPFGDKNRELPASVLGVIPFDLSAVMQINANVRFLGAFIEALRGSADLGGFIRVAETFITAILTVSTMAASDLRATIGRPECAGGTGSLSMAAFLEVQHARNLSALIDSFAESNLGASINTGNIIHALDVINVIYSPRKEKKIKKIKATDTIQILYSPFRGYNLGAFIQAELRSTNLGASLTAAFPLPKVLPSRSSMTAADLRAGEELNIQEVRLQLEGDLQEFLYVNGTDDALIMDANQAWRINIRSFKPIAENLFGDFAAARICRLGALTSFASLDEAVRFCINAVVGLSSQAQLGGSITARGQFVGLRASVGISNFFKDLTASANRVFSSPPLPAIIEGTGGYQEISSIISGIGSGTGNMPASIDPFSSNDLVASITGT